MRGPLGVRPFGTVAENLAPFLVFCEGKRPFEVLFVDNSSGRGFLAGIYLAYQSTRTGFAHTAGLAVASTNHTRLADTCVARLARFVAVANAGIRSPTAFT